jgi:AcrR family transcriptional regulator
MPRRWRARLAPYPLFRGQGEGSDDGRIAIPHCYIHMVNKAADTRDVIAAAALEFIDEHGVNALTLRAIGQATGFHHTAVYRHFKDRNDILSAVNAIVVKEGLDRAGDLPDEPRERLLALARGFRSAMHDHPAVAISQLLPVASLADSEPVATMQSHILAALAELGLTGTELLVHHRVLESFVLGASIFDFGGAPDHLESRRQRLRHVTDPAFEVATRDLLSIDELNETAFDRGLVLIVDECARVGAAALDDGSARPG